MEQRQNARAGETADPLENPPTSGFVRHDSHERKPGSDPAGNQTRSALVGGESVTATISLSGLVPSSIIERIESMGVIVTSMFWPSSQRDSGCAGNLLDRASDSLKRADEGEARYGAASECKGGENWRSPRKPASERHRPDTIPPCENPGMTRPGFEPGFALVEGGSGQSNRSATAAPHLAWTLIESDCSIPQIGDFLPTGVVAMVPLQTAGRVCVCARGNVRRGCLTDCSEASRGARRTGGSVTSLRQPRPPAPPKQRRLFTYTDCREIQYYKLLGILEKAKTGRARLSPRRTGFNSRNRAGRCRWSAGFLGDLQFPPPLQSGAAPYSLKSPSSALKTSLLRAGQISSLTHFGFLLRGGVSFLTECCVRFSVHTATVLAHASLTCFSPQHGERLTKHNWWTDWDSTPEGTTPTRAPIIPPASRALLCIGAHNRTFGHFSRHSLLFSLVVYRSESRNRIAQTPVSLKLPARRPVAALIIPLSQIRKVRRGPSQKERN
ncbi:hypothetical protein PR048_032679 [Dryococelus australis]|uniref:Uncharacterized protein n=1 Tax=Dryococelus australis TaxID=614101 RepID=A0ABQ9G615_9NEOP|nr:hypothetical protein PR048_032679 [Dryococelus australis]